MEAQGSATSCDAVACDISDPAVYCAYCDEVFPSRNRLFKHLQTVHGHPHLLPDATERVALIFAYLGDGFHGSSRMGGEQSHLPTVEDTLLTAMAAHGATGFTRCARTDKGVHALHNVISIKLPPQLSANVPSWLAAVNTALPHGVRLLARIPVAPDFDARRLCDRRTYHYMLPYSALRRDDAPNESCLEVRMRLKRALKSFVGTHDFAHFTRRGEYAQANDTRRVMFRLHAVGTVGPEDACGDVVEDGSTVAGGEVESGEVESAAGEEAAGMVLVSISGQSFLQFQIRKMMGATVGVMRGALPPDWITSALADARSNARTASSLVSPPKEAPASSYASVCAAPAFPLYLDSVSFTPYARKLKDGMIDPARPCECPASACFRRRLHLHILRMDARERAFAKWLSERDANGWLERDGDDPTREHTGHSEHPPPPNLSSMPHDMLVQVLTHLTGDVLLPHTALCEVNRDLHACHELRALLESLREHHRLACALAVRCGDWEARFKRGCVSQVNWVSIGLAVPDLHVFGRMCASANMGASLMRLNLRDNGISSTGMAELGKGLVHLSALEYLNLEQNAICVPTISSDDPLASLRSTGLYCFFRDLKPTHLTALNVLHLADNGLDVQSEVGAKASVSLAIQLFEGGCLPALQRCSLKDHPMEHLLAPKLFHAVQIVPLGRLLKSALFIREMDPTATRAV